MFIVKTKGKISRSFNSVAVYHSTSVPFAKCGAIYVNMKVWTEMLDVLMTRTCMSDGALITRDGLCVRKYTK